MNSLQANICLLFVTLCWSTEVIIFACIPDAVPPFATTCITSLVGALILFFSFNRRIRDELKRDKKKVIIRCIYLGVLNCTYNVLYLYGLKFFDVSSGAFTLSMTVVILPVILISFKQKVAVKTWISAVMVLTGIVLALGRSAGGVPVTGMIMIGIGCIVRAVYIVMLNRYASDDDPVALSAFVSGVVGVISAGLWFVSDPSGFGVLPWTKEVVASIAIYSYFIVGFAQTLNIFAQKKSTPANATIIYSTEIIFSIIWGSVLPASIVDKTVITPWIILGMLMVVGGNLVQIIPSRKESINEA